MPSHMDRLTENEFAHVQDWSFLSIPGPIETNPESFLIFSLLQSYLGSFIV